MRRLPLISLALVAAVAACSSSDSSDPLSGRHTNAPPPDGTSDTPPGPNDTVPPMQPGTPPPAGTMVTTDATWMDGMKITSNQTIAAGVTITIAPGATVTISPDVSITVAGTLKAATNTTHAKLEAAAGGGAWGGLVVASGGTLSLDSVDLVNSKIALWTQKSNAGATYANGTITANQPFQMEAGSKLSISKSSATAGAASSIAGTFDASYLTYDKGTSEGIYSSGDTAAAIHFADSTLKGNGGGDYLVITNAATLKVEYTTISGSHCPFHFNAPGPVSYTIDHVSDNTNGWGPMIYGSGAGPNAITNSNLRDTAWNIDFDNPPGPNGAVTINGNFFVFPNYDATKPPGTTTNNPGVRGMPTGTTIAGSLTKAVANAQPR